MSPKFNVLIADVVIIDFDCIYINKIAHPWQVGNGKGEDVETGAERFGHLKLFEEKAVGEREQRVIVAFVERPANGHRSERILSEQQESKCQKKFRSRRRLVLVERVV